MELVRILGDVSIFESEDGKRYYKLGYTGNKIIEERTKRKREEEEITEVNGYVIRFDKKGHKGYVIYKEKEEVCSGIWYLDEAVKECNRQVKRELKDIR